MGDRPKAFVLMPFDKAFDDVYEGVIVPPLEEAGYEVVRADSRLDQQQILKGVVEGIASAHLVVADLTGLNPNVFYELGIAHGLRKETVVITQSMESVPFDLRPYRVEQYSPQFRDVDRLRHRLREIADLRQEGAGGFGSPVTDFLPMRPSTEAASAPPAAGAAGGEEKGALDFADDFETNSKRMVEVLGEITEDTGSLGGKMNAHTAHLAAMKQRPVQPSAREVREAASAAAADMEGSAARLAVLAPRMEEAVDAMSQGMEGLVRLSPPPESEEEREQAARFSEPAQGLLKATSEALDQVREYRRIIGGLKGISADVTRASRRLTDGLDRVIAGMEKVQAFCSRTILVVDQKLQAGDPATAVESVP